jgi:hypothetical protein
MSPVLGVCGDVSEQTVEWNVGVWWDGGCDVPVAEVAPVGLDDDDAPVFSDVCW